MKTKTHPGFDAIAKRISEKEGMPMEHARAVLAVAARHASAHALEENPRLNRVSGRAKK